jgi:hypothetical protein
LTLTVGVINPGNAPLSIQWRKNGVNIAGATSGRLTLNNIVASDAGSYDAVVTKSCGGEISQPFTLNVHTFSINPTSQNFGASGSNGIINVTSSGSCGWTATSNASWINITSGSSGTGNGTVGFAVIANPTAGSRTGTITVAGQTFTVTQDGTAPMTIQFSASSYTVNESSDFLTITVNRTGDTSQPASVKYSTSDATDVNFNCNPATAGQIVGAASRKCDYHIASGRLRFAAGETSKQIILSIINDVYVEGAEKPDHRARQSYRRHPGRPINCDGNHQRQRRTRPAESDR